MVFVRTQELSSTMRTYPNTEAPGSTNKNHFPVDEYYENQLTIIPRARMGSESIAHEAEGRKGY